MSDFMKPEESGNRMLSDCSYMGSFGSAESDS